MPVTTSEIMIPATDGSGEFKAFTAIPHETEENTPVIIMIQEIFGINQEMQEKCIAKAEEGYIALCPDLFWRIEPNIELVDSVPEQLQRAFELYQTFDADKGIEDLAATLTVSRGIIAGETIEITDRPKNNVGCIGYCLGGMLAYRMAVETDIDASVSYYGVAIESMLDKKHYIQQPLMLHIAGEDEFVPKDSQDKIMSELSTLGAHVHIHRYDGMDHAFARGNGLHYNEEAALLANSRTAKFLEESLG